MLWHTHGCTAYAASLRVMITAFRKNPEESRRAVGADIASKLAYMKIAAEK